MRAALGAMVILADDLSGAAETASMLAPAVPGGMAVLLGAATAGAPMPEPVAVDTDTRHVTPEHAFGLLTDVLAALPGSRLLFKKVDSLLRGNFAAELSALAASGRVVVFAPALPRLDRVLRDSRPSAGGEPLSRTASWRLEPTSAPVNLIDALPEARPILLADVRRGDVLRAALRAASPGAVLVCDAETDEDLEGIARAALDARTVGDLALAGSSALAAALARLLPPDPGSTDAPLPAPVDGPAAFVVGTGEPRARTQGDRLRALGARVMTVDPSDLLPGDLPAVLVAEAVRTLAAPVSVLRIGAGDATAVPEGRRLSRGLARLVAAACASSPPALLTLTGGETARAVLDALGIRRITVLGPVSDGAALAATASGTTVVTRPGSFGGNDDFVRILKRVSPSGYSTLSSDTIPQRKTTLQSDRTERRFP